MNKKTDLVQLRYRSEAANDMGILGLIQILDVSVISNKRQDITGVLFFEKGYFGQILEGPREAVEALWAKIIRDPRHHNIALLGVAEILERRFPQWALKLFDGQEFAGYLPQFSDVIGTVHESDGETLGTMRSLGLPV